MVLKGKARHYHAKDKVSKFGVDGGYTPLPQVTDQDDKPCGAKAGDYADLPANMYSTTALTEL